MLGLDKPNFYFALNSAAYPDTLHRVLKYYDRNVLKKLIAQYGNWEAIQTYWQTIDHFEDQLNQLPDSLGKANIKKLKSEVTQLHARYKDHRIRATFGVMEKQLLGDGLRAALLKDYQELKQSYEFVVANPQTYKLYIPGFQWYGFDNQYHNWFANFFSGKFGYSVIDSQPVESKIWSYLRWTLILNSVAILLVFLLSIPIGVYSAVYRGTYLDQWSTIGLFMLYSLPSFWIATLLIVFFTTPEYGMDWFPSHGLGDFSDDASFGERFWGRLHHMVLPIFCMTYVSLAFVSRQMRGGMLDVMQQDYIRTAWAKGLGKGQVIWKHAFRNALFPIITLVASIFPRVLAGSLVIEVIFSIPGMGKLTIDSITSNDWPVVYTILMISALMTMIGILVADILYAWSDPRVSFEKNKK